MLACGVAVDEISTMDPLEGPREVAEPRDTPPRLRWRWIVALFAAAFVVRFSYFYLDDVAHGMGGMFTRRLLDEGTGNLASLIFFPIAVFTERRFPMDRGRWRRNWWAHTVAFVVYSIAHTTFMAVTRHFLSPAIGLGAYDYGAMSVRYFMEGAQDIISYATFAGLLTLLRVQARLREREVRELQLERAAAKAQLESLTLRLQPHFLFNALNTISATVYDDAAAADELIGRLGELLRKSIASSERQETSLAEELQLLDAYEALIAARFGERVRFVHDVSAEARDCAVPVFLLQPLVENAVKHGSSSERVGNEIVVRGSVRSGQLLLAVENAIDGAIDASAPLGTGLGASVARLRLLYGDAASLATHASDESFRVSVRLPMRPAPPNLERGESREAAVARADR